MSNHNDPLMVNVSELLNFIQAKDPDIDELCQFAVIRTFNFLGAISMFGASLDSTGVIRPIGQFGFKPEVMQSWSHSTIEEDLPTADALKTNNIIWLADKAQWDRDYPHLAKYELEYTANTFVAWPISVRGSYMTVLGLCINRVESPTPSLISFFETVGGIFAMQLSQKVAPAVTPEEDQINALINLFTRRQRDILHLVAEGLTNIQIGGELGFSESTIRQETMRIYEILGASGRADAIRMYRAISRKPLAK